MNFCYEKNYLWKKDYSISSVRFISMCFIIACHIMQRDDFSTDINGAHIGWAFWFNIGVQMFLFISGYLYGKKMKIFTLVFYKKAFPKLLVDYYIFVLVMLGVIYYSPLQTVDSNEMLGLLTFSATIPGMGHLWFVPTILFCYLMTPIFSEIVNAIDRRSNMRFWIESILFIFLVHIVIKRLLSSFVPPWINCFFIGMIYSRIELRGRISKTIFASIVIILCIIIIPIQFRIDYWPHKELPPFFANRYSYFCNYGHVFLGIAVIILFRALYIKISSKSSTHPILEWSDKYSYDVYLVHHIFVQSRFGCVEFISNRWIALPLAIVLSMIYAVLLYHISDFIKRKGLELYSKIPN